MENESGEYVPKYADLAALLEMSELSTQLELVNTALAFYAWGLEETMTGRTIASVDETNKTYKEVIVPGFKRYT